MSAPKTNIERQKRRHIGPLIGMAVVAVLGVLLITYWVFEEVAESDPATPGVETTAPASEVSPEVIPPETPGDANISPEEGPATIAPEPAPQGGTAAGEAPVVEPAPVPETTEPAIPEVAPEVTAPDAADPDATGTP